MSGEKKLMIIFAFGPIVVGFGGCALCVGVAGVDNAATAIGLPPWATAAIVVLAIVLFTGIGLIWSSKKKADREAHIQELAVRWGAQAAGAIARRELWQGMTAEMLVEAIGHPASRDRVFMPDRQREIWRYGNSSVTLDNGYVIGWVDVGS